MSSKERPIIFSGPMVRAILEGRKTQTRRVIKPYWHPGLLPERPKDNEFAVANCPYGQPGDRLWVREAFRQAYPKTSYRDGIVYRADGYRSLGMDEYSDRHRWKPSIHMPKKYARIWLEVTGVRVERVQEISERASQAEGATTNARQPHYRDAFRELWDSINANRGYGWDKNPWVWVVEFRQSEAAA